MKYKASSMLENYEYSIFSPVEASNTVIASEYQTVKGKLISKSLNQEKDISNFLKQNLGANKPQLFTFDKVQNDSNTGKSLYN